MDWYVVNTLPHQEQRAEVNLKRQDFHTFLPMIKRTRRHARRTDTIRAALFPGYLFVHFDPTNQQWSSINGTFGVKRLLCNGTSPIPIVESFVEGLQNAIDEEGFVTAQKNDLAVGQEVRIAEGPFADQVAAITQLAPQDRIKVLLNVLGGYVTATVPRRSVYPI